MLNCVTFFLIQIYRSFFIFLCFFKQSLRILVLEMELAACRINTHLFEKEMKSRGVMGCLTFIGALICLLFFTVIALMLVLSDQSQSVRCCFLLRISLSSRDFFLHTYPLLRPFIFPRQYVF